MESKAEISEASKEASIVQERLNWKLAYRDDAKVAQGLYAGEEIEEMHELSDAGLLDEFFVFLEELGMMHTFEQMRVPGAKRMLVPTVQFVLLYLLKVLFGGQSMLELPRVLFSNLGLMECIMRFALLANFTGIPAITFPVGYDRAGLPVGLQVMGRPWEEALLLRMARASEGQVERRAPRFHQPLLQDAQRTRA